MIHYGNTPEEVSIAREWLEARISEKVPDHAKFVGSGNGSIIHAVCAFSSYTGDDVELSFAYDRKLRGRGLLYAIFSYVFEQLQCARCTAKIREDNTDSIKLVSKVGFVEEGRMRKAKSGKDILVFGLLKEDFYGKFT